jgi:hypothetical protein
MDAARTQASWLLSEPLQGSALRSLRPIINNEKAHLPLLTPLPLACLTLDAGASRTRLCGPTEAQCSLPDKSLLSLASAHPHEFFAPSTPVVPLAAVLRCQHHLGLWAVQFRLTDGNVPRGKVQACVIFPPER